MNRFQAPSTLSFRDRNNAAGSSYSNPSSSATYTPPLSGRSSPYPPYGGYAGSSSTAGQANNSSSSLHSGYGGGGASDALPRWQSHRTAEEVESQNDEKIEGLGAKVKMLKDLTTGIGTEIRESTIQLTQMNDVYEETGTILSGTFRRMNAMASRQGGRWMCYMLFLVVVVWFFIVVWWFRR